MHPLEKPWHPSPFPTPTAAKGSRLPGHKAAGPGNKEPSVPCNRLTKRPAVDHSARIDVKRIEHPSPQTSRCGIRVLPGTSPNNPSSLCLDKSFSSKRNRSVDSAIGSLVSSAGSFGDPEKDLPTRNWGDLVVASDTLEGSLSLTLGDLRLQHKADLNLAFPADATSPPTDQESPCGQQYPSPQDGSGVGASHSNTSSSQSLKRPSRPNNDDNDEDQGKEIRKGKRRVGPTGSREPFDSVLYSCPFRKLDPTTINVRDHDKCANNPWKGISNLKSHIKYSHDFNRYPCRRCWDQFDTTEALHLHMRSRESCPLRESLPNMTDPKDGITIVARQILGSRKDDEKVTSWDRLWTVLFGEGVPIKDHNFVPVVELEEVMLEFDVQLPSFIAAFDAHVKKLFGELVNHSFRQQIEGIKKFVQQWMRELLDKCREIPSRMQKASSPSDLSRHIGPPAERTPEDARFNPSLLGIGTQGEDRHEACNFLTEWMTNDRVSDVMMADQMDRPLNNVDITRNWQHPGLRNREIERVSQQTADGWVFDQHCPPNGNIITRGSLFAGSAILG
ncbi:hypothetical protein B0T18DRAFT_123501 [Schizothecium vesticola]|uniref:C2H2-type domain-containing protein n=1 Tax=Schizothecium vesticola TaxID=314040 RepID=A0AA40F3D5_9PEZI|nr:hypothetical protein B0T18DRAFT_123501 [Schizothecium vesticola]